MSTVVKFGDPIAVYLSQEDPHSLGFVTHVNLPGDDGRPSVDATVFTRAGTHHYVYGVPVHDSADDAVDAEENVTAFVPSEDTGRDVKAVKRARKTAAPKPASDDE